MNTLRFFSVLLLLSALLILAACSGGTPSYEDRETFEQQTYTVPENTNMVFVDRIVSSAYGEESAEGTWLAGCSSSDRDDFFDAYTLRCETTENENTTFTYLIYYPHGGDAVTVTPELLVGESEYVINLHYEKGDGIKGYSLCYLSITLPTSVAPRVRLLVDEDVLGVMSTVTESHISTVDPNG